MMAAQLILSGPSSAPMLARCSAIRSGEARSDFVAIATRLGVLGSAASSPPRYRSPGPMRWLAGRQTPTTSTWDQVARTTSLSRSPNRVRGLCRPGVSINTSWASGRCTTPRTACRVVCGFEEAMTIFWPTRALVRVDLPAFGRPTTDAKPERKRVASEAAVTVASSERFDSCGGSKPQHPPAVHFDGCDGKRTPESARPSQLDHLLNRAAPIGPPD